MIVLTRQQVLKLAGEASVDPRTVSRIYDGKKSLGLVFDRVAAAAKKLKLPVPKKGDSNG